MTGVLKASGPGLLTLPTLTQGSFYSRVTGVIIAHGAVLPPARTGEGLADKERKSQKECLDSADQIQDPEPCGHRQES